MTDLAPPPPSLAPAASAQVPGGVRVGLSALTSRSMGVKDMETVASFLHRAVQISLVLQKEAGSKLLKDFVAKATTGEGEGRQQIEQLRKDVLDFSVQWPLPGVPDTTTIKRFDH